MSQRPPLRIIVVLAAALLVAALALLGVTDGALGLAPAVLLALPLAFGRYVGEDVVVALATRERRPRAVRTLRARVPLAPRVLGPRGGRLIAAALAERGPPAVSAA